MMNKNYRLVREAIELPAWMSDELSKRASRIGLEPQDLIKTWVAERLDKIGK